MTTTPLLPKKTEIEKQTKPQTKENTREEQEKTKNADKRGTKENKFNQGKTRTIHVKLEKKGKEEKNRKTENQREKRVRT